MSGLRSNDGASDFVGVFVFAVVAAVAVVEPEEPPLLLSDFFTLQAVKEAVYINMTSAVPIRYFLIKLTFTALFRSSLVYEKINKMLLSISRAVNYFSHCGYALKSAFPRDRRRVFPAPPKSNDARAPKALPCPAS